MCVYIKRETERERDNFIYSFAYFWLCVRGCIGFALAAVSRGSSLVEARRLLISVISLAVEHRPQVRGLKVVAALELLQLLQLSSCSSRALEQRLNGCGTSA